MVKWLSGAVAGLGLLLAGCASDGGGTFTNDPALTGVAAAAGTPSAPGLSPQSGEIIKIGDVITVSISDIPTPPAPFEVKVRDDGTITLLLNQRFTVAGTNVAAAERIIHDHYVPRFFTQMTVALRLQNGFYWVDGEVKSANRYPYLGPTTVLKAIASAGDFTDWANKRNVTLTRTDHSKFKVDCIKALGDPSLDLEVYPGDKVHVPRRLF